MSAMLTRILSFVYPWSTGGMVRILLVALSPLLLPGQAFSGDGTVIIVGAPVRSCATDEAYCRNDAERDAMRKKREEDARRAEQERVARERAAAAREAELTRFGSHRRAEMERMEKMRENAAAARGGAAPVAAASQPATPPAPKVECTTKRRSGGYATGFKYKTQADAEQALANNGVMTNTCGGAYSMSGSSCSSANVSFTPAVIRWQCRGTYTCAKAEEVCKSTGPSGASRQ